MGGSNIFAIKLTPGVLSSVQAAGNSFVVLSAPRSLKIRPTQGGASQSFVSYPRGSGLSVPLSEQWKTLALQIDAGVVPNPDVVVVLFVGFETFENFRTFSAGQHTPVSAWVWASSAIAPTAPPNPSAIVLDSAGTEGIYSVGGTGVILLKMKRIALQVFNNSANTINLYNQFQYDVSTGPFDVLLPGVFRQYPGLSGDIRIEQVTSSVFNPTVTIVAEIYDCIELPTTGQPGG